MQAKRVDYIGIALAEWTESRPSKGYNTIAPSALGGCPRAHFLKIKGIPATTPPKAGAQVGFEVGRTWEAFMAKVLEDQGLLVKWYQDGVDEPLVHPTLNLSGTPDYLIQINGKLLVADSKTMRSDYFWNMEREYMMVCNAAKRTGSIIPTKAKFWTDKNEAYVMQTAAYIKLCRANGLDVQGGLIFFASKNDGFIGMELEIPWTAELDAEVTERIKYLQGYLNLDQLPPCTCEGWKVQYCDYGDPTTQEEKQIRQTKNKRLVNTECCSANLYLKETA